MVDGFFPGGCIKSIELGIGTTDLLLKVVDDARPEVIGYVSVGLDGFKLSGRERIAIGGTPFAAMGAVRIGMIGIDHRYHEKGHGGTLLATAIGLAESVAETVPVRFLVADVNPAAEGFYVKHDFVPNAAEDAQRKNAATGTVGMRLDLLETVPA